MRANAPHGRHALPAPAHSRRRFLTATLFTATASAVAAWKLAGTTASNPPEITGGSSPQKQPKTPAPQPPAPQPTPTPPDPKPAVGLTEEKLSQVVAQHEGNTPTAFGLDLPGIMQQQGNTYAYLTLDLCGGPGGDQLDQALIDFLVESQVPATIFVNQRWLRSNPEKTTELAQNPLFLLENHGSRHLPVTVAGQAAYGITGTASVQEAALEVAENTWSLVELTGREPRFFRSGTAHYDDVGIALVRDLGQIPTGFSVNADGGATFSAEQVAQQLGSVQAGDIIIAHANRPYSGTATGMQTGISAALSRGVRFATLDQV